jgi:hypothetical protein
VAATAAIAPAPCNTFLRSIVQCSLRGGNNNTDQFLQRLSSEGKFPSDRLAI